MENCGATGGYFVDLYTVNYEIWVVEGVDEGDP